MDQRSPNHPKIDNLLLALIIMIGSLLFTWTREIYLNGWSLETFFNIANILLFLLTSYSIESKTRLSTTTRGLFYFSYFFIVGTFATVVIYKNPINGQMLFVYLFLSFIGSLIWQFICKKLKTKK